MLLLPGTVAEGADAIRAAFADVFAQLPHAVFAEKSATTAADVVLLEWTLEADGVVADDGIDTLVVRDGLIHAQTARFTPRPR